MSKDEFKGYLDDDNLIASGDSHDPSDDAQDSSQPDGDAGCTPIPEFGQPLEDMTGPSLQFFEQMVTKEMLEKIVDQTNLCAQ